MGIGRIKRFFVGDPLASEMMQHERITKWKALAVLSSDALSSVAYATEEVLIPLAMFSAAAVSWSLPIAGAIGFLLIVITISYQQTIDAYPGGGGAYTVAKENLGQMAGLVAGASLLIDYILTVSVSVAAGVENVISALPALGEHKEMICIVIILVIMLFNLRGVRESANIFALPTYMFIFSFLILIVFSAYRFMTGQVVAIAPIAQESYPAIPIFLILRAFASGCSALTGIEAISNGIPIFKEPAQRNAKITMIWMSTILGVLFLSMTVLCRVYGIIPKEGETAVSLLSHAVFGENIMYYIVQASTALILVLAANTSYADFPRLSSLLAKDRFLPRQLASLGDRLVFSNGIVGLSFAAILLIIVFRGDTHHLIPLYAVGVFLSFTLSQSGMVVHHLKLREPGWKKSLAFNALGALTTLIVVSVIAITKFIHGAWVVILLIPFLVIIFEQIHAHYTATARKLAYASVHGPHRAKAFRHTAIVPISGIHPGVLDAISYALSISSDVRACTVDSGTEISKNMRNEWERVAPGVPLVILPSPYRSVIRPILDYVDKVEHEMQGDMVTVIIPEFVTSRWYHKFLHNQTALVLYAALRFRKGIVVTSVRYYV
jgi:amino acid transporter